ISFLARVPERIGYDTERRGLLLTHRVAVPSWKNEHHEIFYYLNLVAELERALFGRQSEEREPQFQIAVSAKRKDEARKLLADDPDKPLGLLCQGSVNSRAKRWPAEGYATLADQLSESGARVALIGSSGEVEVSKHVMSLATRPPLVLTGK